MDIEDYCNFGPERVYVLMALARGKENAEIDGPPSMREVVADESELSKALEKLRHNTERFDNTYRLYLSANARDAPEASVLLQKRMLDWLNGSDGQTRKTKEIDHEWKSVLQKPGCKADSRFVFDVDDPADPDPLREELRSETTVVAESETPNGHHLVTEPFDYKALETEVEYEIKTDGLLFVEFL